MGQKFHNIEFGNDFLDMTPKAQATTTKIDKVDFMRIRNFVYQNTVSAE